MRYSYIGDPNNKKHLYIAPSLSTVKDGTVNMHYYSKKTIPPSLEIIRFPVNFVSKKGVVLSFADAPNCHMFLPETHALFNSWVILHVENDLPITKSHIINDMLCKVYSGVMKEWRTKQKREIKI